MKTRLFIYGTLQFPAMMRAVLGRELPLREALLPGFARYQVRRRVFPAIVPAADGRVAGYMAADVGPRALDRIDDYEGPPFRRQAVRVYAPDDDRPVEAFTYVLRPRYRCLLLDRDWDPEWFRRQWHAYYVREFETIYGTRTD